MRPLTEHTPKPLIEVCGKPLLAHIIEALPKEIDEVVLVVGYLQEQIREHCGEMYLGKKVTYAQQENFSGGTGDALLCTKDIVKGTFMLLNGDDIYGASALQKIIGEEHAIFGVYSDTPEHFGVLKLNVDGTLQEIVEKPQNPSSNFINIGGYVLNSSIFDYNIEISQEHGELLVTDMVTAYAQDNPIKIVEQDMWLPIGYPEHIKKAEIVLCPEV